MNNSLELETTLGLIRGFIPLDTPIDTNHTSMSQEGAQKSVYKRGNPPRNQSLPQHQNPHFPTNSDKLTKATYQLWGDRGRREQYTRSQRQMLKRLSTGNLPETNRGSSGQSGMSDRLQEVNARYLGENSQELFYQGPRVQLGFNSVEPSHQP